MILKVAGSNPVGHPKLPAAAGRFLRPAAAANLTRSRFAGYISPDTYCLSSSMAEQRTLNPQVLGSNPRGGTSTTPTGAACAFREGSDPPCLISRHIGLGVGVDHQQIGQP